MINFSNISIEGFKNHTLDLKEFDFLSAIAFYANSGFMNIGIHKIIIITALLWQELQKFNAQIAELEKTIADSKQFKQFKEIEKTLNIIKTQKEQIEIMEERLAKLEQFALKEGEPEIAVDNAKEASVYTEEELKSMNIIKLKKLASDLGVKSASRSRASLINVILTHKTE